MSLAPEPYVGDEHEPAPDRYGDSGSKRDQPGAPAVDGAPLLAAYGLGKAYGRRRVLDGVTFTVPPGLLVGIEGENGAGKSTLLKCLVGLLRPDSGRIETGGRLGYCPQDPALVEMLTCREHIVLFGAGYGLSRERAVRRGDELMTRFGCARFADDRIDRLSGGTRQKINLIGALLADPDLLVLDEPYQGFDYETYLTFWEHAEELRRDGRGVLVVSHMHTEQARFDAMLVLRDGAVTARGPAADRVLGAAA
jgi:ABC-type multidrug transport system ATPase subunit